MDENIIIARSKGFIPRSFINLPEDEVYAVFESNGVWELIDESDSYQDTWQNFFMEVNASIAQSLPDELKTTSLSKAEIPKEIDKLSEGIGNTMLYMYLNISQEDWFQRITEFMVYIDNSIGSFAGSIIYWLTLQCLLKEESISPTKGKYFLQFIEKRYAIIAKHKYFDEIETFARTFPLKPLQLEVYNLTDIISILELYPNGKLNRFISNHFPKIPKTLTREKVSQVLHKYVKSALSGFDAEKLWREGSIDAIKEFLIESTIQKNRITNLELLNSSKTDYIYTIKNWLHSQTTLFKELIDIEQIKTSNIQKSEQDNTPKIPAKYYALYHRILIDIKHEKDFQRLDDDRYSRKEIEVFAQKHYPFINAQSFYRGFIELEDLANKTAISRSFKDLKQKITMLSENHPDVLHYLKQFPG
jgi:hypothetical protein